MTQIEKLPTTTISVVGFSEPKFKNSESKNLYYRNVISTLTEILKCHPEANIKALLDSETKVDMLFSSIISTFNLIEKLKIKKFKANSIDDKLSKSDVVIIFYDGNRKNTHIVSLLDQVFSCNEITLIAVYTWYEKFEIKKFNAGRFTDGTITPESYRAYRQKMDLINHE